jgi:hypothetical protein
MNLDMCMLSARTRSPSFGLYQSGYKKVEDFLALN